MTCFCLPTTDQWLLAVLNSPLMWAYMSRTVIHGKDEVLRLKTIYMEQLPIVLPPDPLRAQILQIVDELTKLSQQYQVTQAKVLTWLATEFGITAPSQAFEWLANLSTEEFVAQVRTHKSSKERRLSPNDISALQRIYEEYILPLRTIDARTKRLEHLISDLINEAYQLTAEEIELLWKTAPPRMPVTR